ncbi:MAG: NAAT family transporter [Alphaproteobacteria bacterium]|nr:NAAT family transporter [Alphaproteobacteria bacterium]
MSISAWVVDYLHFSLAMLAVCAPQSAIPVFVSLTDGMGSREKENVARQTGTSVAVVLITAALIGSYLLSMFGISLNSFRIAGGILLMSIAFGMMRANEKRHTKEEQDEAENRDTALGVMPLAIPVISGPGSISAMIIATQLDKSFSHFIAVCCAAVTVGVASWFLLHISDFLARILGQTGLNIIGRLCGMLLAALAVEFIYTSLKAMFPAWIA